MGRWSYDEVDGPATATATKANGRIPDHDDDHVV